MTTRSRLLLLAGLLALAPATAGAQERSALRLHTYVAFNGLYRATETTFSDTVDIDVYQEAGSLTSTLTVGGPAFDVAAGGPIEGYARIGLSYAFGYFRQSAPAAVGGQVPHPFFFDQHRVVAGSAELEREERTFHLSVLWLVPMSDRFQAILFGGPSYFWVRQETVANITFSESYPYDDATFTAATVTRQTTRGWGYNVGVDLAYYFTEHAGFGALIRYAPATVDLPSDAGVVPIDVGGLKAGGGVRFRF